ncbi:MAG: hypothetical protein H7Z77_10075 [Chitinophagaceae bacterium]|nr:hypothetical protein [Polaromonas sp.]
MTSVSSAGSSNVRAADAVDDARPPVLRELCWKAAKIELQTPRTKLQLMLGKPASQTPNDDTLQMFCRLGYTPGVVPATPRRALDKFIQAS